MGNVVFAGFMAVLIPLDVGTRFGVTGRIKVEQKEHSVKLGW